MVVIRNAPFIRSVRQGLSPLPWFGRLARLFGLPLRVPAASGLELDGHDAEQKAVGNVPLHLAGILKADVLGAERLASRNLEVLPAARVNLRGHGRQGEQPRAVDGKADVVVHCARLPASHAVFVLRKAIVKAQSVLLAQADVLVAGHLVNGDVAGTDGHLNADNGRLLELVHHS